MLDIFNWNDSLEDWWARQVSHWKLNSEAAILSINLNSWSF